MSCPTAALRTFVRGHALRPIPRHVVSGIVSGTCGRPPCPLGRTPSLHGLRGLPTALFARFVGTMDPLDSPAAYMSGFDAPVFPDRPRPLGRGRRWGLPVLAHGVSTHAQGLRLRGVEGQLALFAAVHVAFPLSGQGRHAEVVISELHGWPACTLSFASPATSRSPAPDSGPRRFATPFSCGSLIRDSMPVYPGAFVAVGTALAGGPPHRSVLEELPHTALTSGS